MIKGFFRTIGILLVFGLGVALTYFFMSDKTKSVTYANSSVLLEKVEEVCKLVTVEGTFSELYDETNMKEFTFYLPLPSTFNFYKSAILQVQGKVLVGYDMDSIQVSADSINRIIYLENLPQPEIISIDHDIQYKNLRESWFNTFKAEDYTILNKNAKAALAQKAKEANLLEKAEAEGNQLIEVIRFIAENAGWTVQIKGADVLQSSQETLSN